MIVHVRLRTRVIRRIIGSLVFKRTYCRSGNAHIIKDKRKIRERESERERERERTIVKERERKTLI